MVIYREFKELKGVSSPVHWAMGMFDGLHLGHAGVIAAAVEGAARDGGIAAVLTFRTHPLARKACRLPLWRWMRKSSP